MFQRQICRGRFSSKNYGLERQPCGIAQLVQKSVVQRRHSENAIHIPLNNRRGRGVCYRWS